MHLSISKTLILPVLLAVGPAAADSWTIQYQTIVGVNCCASGTWFNDFGNTWNQINFEDGCRAPYVTNVKEFCIDWGNGRGHFITDWNEKRCMRFDSQRTISEGDVSALYQTFWKQSSCDW